MTDPRIEIRKAGRWRYELVLYPGDGMADWIGFEGPTVFGRRRAERRAARHLRRELQRQQRRTPVAIIRPAGPLPEGNPIE
ncbi:MAG TPA: hypothetical protein VFR23_17890 [Jiangellaceae bacterium]|nr:hypothetical protein [Jiangellaceae bacterium]